MRKSKVGSPMVLAGALAALALAGTSNAQRARLRVEVTPIRGNQRMLQPSVGASNLDAGDLIAGNTWWRVQGVFFVETHVGFLAKPGEITQAFAIPQSLYWNDNLQSPAAIADDGTVVGTNWFKRTFQSFPFRWTEVDGFDFLPLPGPTWLGWAVALSRDGRIAAGAAQLNRFADGRAARWVDGQLELIGSEFGRSETYGMSADGAVIVGENGQPGAAQATRWVEGVEVGLETQGLPFSTARFVSDDGSTVIGRASLGGEVLVRWTADGSVYDTYAPPRGLSIAVLNAIAPDARTVVGALTDGSDQSPFVWRLGRGFQVLGELGRPGDYDLSEAVDVSDDGRRVVGTLSSSVVFNGDPPQTAVLWTGGRTQPLDDLLVAGGQAARGLFSSHAISGNGDRILTTGVPRPRPQDTTAVLLELVSGPSGLAGRVIR